MEGNISPDLSFPLPPPGDPKPTRSIIRGLRLVEQHHGSPVFFSPSVFKILIVIFSSGRYRRGKKPGTKKMVHLREVEKGAK